jgi:hypothetical protein
MKDEKRWAKKLARQIEAAFSEDRPYRRPGAGPGMLLTDAQWALYDQAVAARARQRARFGTRAEQLLGTGGRGVTFGGPSVARARFVL